MFRIWGESLDALLTTLVLLSALHMAAKSNLLLWLVGGMIAGLPLSQTLKYNIHPAGALGGHATAYAKRHQMQSAPRCRSDWAANYGRAMVRLELHSLW